MTGRRLQRPDRLSDSVERTDGIFRVAAHAPSHGGGTRLETGRTAMIDQDANTDQPG